MKKNQGFAAIIPLLILFLGLLVAVFLVGQKVLFNPRASETPPTTSPWGNAVRFTNTGGVNGYLTVSPSSSLKLGSTFTIEFWIKPNVSNPVQQVVLSKAVRQVYPYAQSPVYIQYQNAGLSLWTNGSPVAYAPASLKIGTWNFVALSYNAGSLNFIVNSSSATFSNIPFNDTNTPMAVNGLLNIVQNGTTIDFPIIDAEIDDLRISTISRYPSGSPGNISLPFKADSSTILLYHFDDPKLCNAQTGFCYTPDASANRNDGQINLNPLFIVSTIPYTSPTTHKACVNNACTTVPGVDTDKCQADKECMPVNRPPLVNFSWAIYKSCGIGPCIINPYKIVFTNSSIDLDNDPMTYVWSFGDGTTSTVKSPTHAYPRVAGKKSYLVSLTVRDNHGGKALKTATVTVGQ